MTSSSVQLSMPLVVDDDHAAEDNATLIVMAGQARRRMWGRRAAVATLHARTAMPYRRDGRGAPTAGQRTDLDRLDTVMAALAHLGDYDREEAAQ